MCILFIHTGGADVRGYRLILASNRDEFFQRPASHAAPWKEDAGVIGGRDMEPGREGGTWLALSHSRKKLGALLNLPGAAAPENARGRGSIVSNFVLGEKSTAEYLQHFHEFGNEYPGFNLVTVEIGDKSSKAYHYSNADDKILRYNEGEAVGFGNSLPDTPLRKVEVGTKRFNEIVHRHVTDNTTKETLVDELLELLQWKEYHTPDPELARRKCVPQAAAIFFAIPEFSYGTRTHTVILVDADGIVDFYEWTMVIGESEWAETHLKNKI